MTTGAPPGGPAEKRARLRARLSWPKRRPRSRGGRTLALLARLRTTDGRKHLAELLALASSVGTTIAVLIAGSKYVFGFFSPVELPPIIEFRCASVDFDAASCTVGPRPYLYHTTITAALNLRGVGDRAKEATVTSALAVLQFGPSPRRSYKLTGIWSGDFVTGQPFSRKQVTVHSLKGGETGSQEMWFFPLQEPCGERTREACAEDERRNFLPWQSFIAGISATLGAQPVSETAYTVDFRFRYREGGDPEVKDKNICCKVEITNTVLRLADAENYKSKGVLSISAPCIVQPDRG